MQMKVYIVTTGCYSDYCIEKVFTDRDKAEQYREWCRDANDVEEYDTEDDVQFNKFYCIRVSYRVNDNGLNEEPKVYIEKCIKEQVVNGYTHVSDAHVWGGRFVDISISRYIPEQNWNEEFYRNKYIKAIYDFAAITRQKLFEGFTDEQITKMFNATYKD